MPSPTKAKRGGSSGRSSSSEVLYFESYELHNEREIHYNTRYDNHLFTVSINYHQAFPEEWATAPPTDLFLGLGMAVISHVWSAVCTPVIIVKAGHLTSDEVAFWQETYTKTLVEHFLVNQIEDLGGGGGLVVEIRVDAPPQASTTAPPSALAPAPASESPASADTSPWSTAASDASRVRCLVPLGGGKDSATVLELVKRAGCGGVVPFFLSDPEGEFADSWRYEAICDLAGCEAPLVADFAFNSANWRALQKVRKLTPNGAKWDDSARLWACLVAFAASLGARLRSCDHVAVGNERSANLGNGVSWGGYEVNHQYDKSFAYEAHMHAYLKSRGGPYFFSALQPLWDVQVALALSPRLTAHPPLHPLTLAFTATLDPDADPGCG